MAPSTFQHSPVFQRMLGGPPEHPSVDPIAVFRNAHGGKFIRSGKGYRTNCPACDDRKQALAVSESDGWLRLYCFRCGADRAAILATVGLQLRDVGPPRSWPETPEERRLARRAIRDAGFGAALATLAGEALVVRVAAMQIARWKPLSEEDDARLAQAVDRITRASAVLINATGSRQGASS